MPLIPFASLSIWDNNDLWAIQSSVIVAILLAALVFAAFKTKKFRIPIIALPYIALPALLFASINGKLEFASNDRLQCISMLIGAILIFSQKELYSKWLFRGMLICANLHLAIQICGVIITTSPIPTLPADKMAISSFFPLANEIMFFYMLAAFSAVFAFCMESGFWKKYAAIIGSLSFISIVLGDPATIGRISSEDAVGIWLGLACGTLFTVVLFLWKKLGLPKTPAIYVSAFIFLAIVLAPVITVSLQIIPKNFMGEALTRLVNWQAAWNLVKENPFGVGFGAYGANVMQHWPTIEEAYTVWPGIVFISAHNQYLQILTEIGWLGLLYYSALFALPWLIAISRYLRTGELQFLFIAGMLATVLSVMEVSEAMSMFAFIQIIHWGLLIYCVKAVLPYLPQPCQKHISLCFLWLLPLVPLIAYLLLDRGRQLHSMTFSDPMDRGIPDSYENTVKGLDRALEIYPKNRFALNRRVYMHFISNENDKALKALENLEEISGYLMPVNNFRMEIYLRMGNRKKACEIGGFIFPRFADSWTLELKERTDGCR